MPMHEAKTRPAAGTPAAVIRHRVGLVLAALAAAAALTLSGYFLYSAFSTYHRLLTEKVDNSPYNSQYKANTYPGAKFLAMMKSNHPEGEVHAIEGNSNVAVLVDGCKSDAPSSMLAAGGLQGDGYKLVVQVYGAGQARAQFTSYSGELKSCARNANLQASETSYDGGILMTAGDAIVGVLGSGDKFNAAVDYYRTELRTALSNTQCVAVDESDEDAKRSFYYDRDGYAGYMKQEDVSVDASIPNNAVPQALSDAGMSQDALYRNPVDSTKKAPESPLPAGMQSNLPSAPAVTKISSTPSKPALTKTISYQQEDPYGPGCGWYWSGQVPPNYNKSDLDKNKNNIVENAKNEITANIESYKKSSSDWARATLLAMKSQKKWEDYTKQVSDVYASWTSLDNARIAYEPIWDAYVNDYNNWKSFSTRQADASKDYADRLNQCVARVTGNPSTGTATTDDPDGDDDGDGTPNKSDPDYDKNNRNDNTGSTSSGDAMATCKAQISRPSILDAVQGEQPQQPTLPQNFTIPDSWKTKLQQ